MMKLASLASFILAASATADDNVTGDLDVWDDIFASRDYHILADAQANGLIWTEGPVIVTNNNGDGDVMLYFSDVIAAKTYSLDVDKAIRDRTKDKANNSDATTSNILDTYLHVIKERMTVGERNLVGMDLQCLVKRHENLSCVSMELKGS